jgi:hypothetical protein
MPRQQASLPQSQNASGIRLKALQGMGQKNPDADHAKQCGNCLDHNNCPLRPRGNKTAWPAEQSKEFPEPQWFRGATDDFRQQRMSRRGQAAREDGNTRAESRYNLDEYVPDGREPSRVGKIVQSNSGGSRSKTAVSQKAKCAPGQTATWFAWSGSRVSAAQRCQAADDNGPTTEWVPDQRCGSFGMLSANPLKQASRSSCSLRKRQSITPFAAGGFGLGRGAMIAS